MKSEIFEQAYADFVPAKDDNPDAIPYYRAFAGLRAAWGEDFYLKYNHAVHQAACWCGGLNGDRYQVAVATIMDLVEKTRLPDPPRMEMSWDSEPNPPTENDARGIFNASFKKAFPGKRLNSKFAREKWEEKRELAMNLAQEEYEGKKAAYDAKQAKIDQRNADATAIWEEQVRKIEEFKRAAAEALAEK